jgi:hypothetical protein
MDHRRGGGREAAEEWTELFLQKFGFAVHLTAKGHTCPLGEETCLVGKHEHGNQFTVLIKRAETGPDLIKTSDGVTRKRPLHGFTFEYWAKEINAIPTTTEVVQRIAEANTWPIDADSVFHLLGGRVAPSKANAMAKLSKRFKEFFTAEELKEVNKLR